MARRAEAASAPTATMVDGEAAEYLGLYRRMQLIRRFEDAVQSLFQQSLVHGTTHLYSGEEAGAVGVCSVLGPNDRVAATYRGHGAALALGVSTEGLMAELLGRVTGVCEGRAGSMNVVDLEHRLIGCFSIVGGSVGAATGAALALKRIGGVAVAFFGEGTVNQGYLPECLNYAAVFNLPVVYVCENNGYTEFTDFRKITAGEITDRPRALGIHSEIIDGNDMWTVREAAAAAVQRARDGGGPQFIESITYRFVGHSRSDPGAYRPDGELEYRRQRDPLAVARQGLSERYGVTEQELDGVDESVEQEISEAVEAAKAAPFPEPVLAREFKDA
jgi:acetoin:2,6-dichlorophenolindophenol oxidoreductase subunit alpha